MWPAAWPKTSTSGPTRSTHGARMNTACTRPSRPSKEIALKRIDLAAKGVATHRHIDCLERDGGAALDAGIQNLGGQQDHPGTRAVGRHAFGQPCPQRLEQFELAQQVAHRGGLAAGYHQRVDGLELVDSANGCRVGARLTQRRQMFAGVALQREHADARRVHSRAGV